MPPQPDTDSGETPENTTGTAAGSGAPAGWCTPKYPCRVQGLQPGWARAWEEGEGSGAAGRQIRVLGLEGLWGCRRVLPEEGCKATPFSQPTPGCPLTFIWSHGELGQLCLLLPAERTWLTPRETPAEGAASPPCPPPAAPRRTLLRTWVLPEHAPQPAPSPSCCPWHRAAAAAEPAPRGR